MIMITIKKLNLILFTAFIFLIIISAVLHANISTLIKPAASEAAIERQAVKELCENAAKLFAGFFSESHTVKFYSDIDTFAKSQNLHISSVTHRSAPADSSYFLINVNKTLFTINLTGRYTDIKNFLFILETQPYINSFESLKLFPAAVPGRAALEAQYALYSFSSLKPFKPGASPLITKFTPFRKTARIDSIDKSIAVDLFENRSPRASNIDALSTSATRADADSSAPETSEVSSGVTPILAPVANPAAELKLSTDNKSAINSGRLIYNGYYLDSKKGIKAFIDFDGRIEVISAGSAAGGSYIVTSLSESKVSLVNTEEPYDTIEAFLNATGR